MKTLIITPTYNEAENIEKFAKSVLSKGHSLLVVDDNSPDGTFEIVRQLMNNYNNLYLILRKSKLGLGSAYREGFKWALENNFDYIVEMDADFSHRIKDLDAMLDKKGKSTLVIGSRYISGGQISGWSLYRKLISISANKFSKFISQSKINDMTSGFRIYSYDALVKSQSLHSKMNGYAFQIEMVMLCINSDIKVIEVPINFVERQKGKSKMNFKIALEAFRYLITIRF